MIYSLLFVVNMLQFKVMKRYYLYDTLLVLGGMVIFFILISLFPGGGINPQYSTVVSAIFAIYIGFAISGSRSRCNDISALLKEGNGYILLIHRLSYVFSDQIRNSLHSHIDNYLVETIDYKLEKHFSLSERTFRQLYSFLLHLPCSDSKQEDAYKNMMSAANSLSINRTKTEALIKSNLSTAEWVATIVFMLITVSVFYFMSDGTVFNSLIYTIAVGGLLLLTVILKRSDSLKWDKNKWTWEPLNDLFADLGLPLYYPALLVENGEISLPPGRDVRLAYYPKPYPDLTDKVVKLVKATHEK